jgi:conjugal transfer pilus assembly protein TraK
MTRSVLLSLALLSAPGVEALQIIDATPGQNQPVNISLKEITAIRVQGGRIRSFFATDGELTVEKDDSVGQIFVRPIVTDKPINVRLTVRTGQTYNLILHVKDIPQEDIEIREAAEVKPSPYGDNPRTTISLLYKSIRSLITSMALEKAPAHVSYKVANKEFKFWDKTKLVLIGNYAERDLIGEKYALTNNGDHVIRLVEQEFYRNRVVAVSIEDLELDPEQTTYVYVVREASQNGRN